ncbi:MAG TPA: iron ABC transporter substrate-binding protein [Acidimicrobiia bacterium]
MRRTTALLAVIAILAACGANGTTTTTEAPADTTDSGTTASGEALTLYSGRNENFVQPVVDAFTAETGIEVEVRYAGTGELATTIMTEGDASPADVFWAQDPAFIGGLAKEGYLTELPEDVLSLVPERFADADGRWVGITARARVFVYNTELVPEEELPADIWEVTDPKWKGRLGVAPTNGSFVAFVTGMILAEGEERTREWLEGIAANEPQIFDGNGPIVDAVVAGDLDAGLVNHYYLLQRIAELGEVPAANHFFSDGDPGGLVMATGAGILASSDKPEEAAELIRYLLSEESQNHFLGLFEYPLVEGIGTPEGQLPLDELPTLDISLTDTADTLDPALALIAEAGLS